MNPSTGLPLNTTLDKLIQTAGESVRSILIDGAREQRGTARAYVNYASGGEPLESIYGQEPWRLERLKKLKREYDPQNRFRFYGPIVDASSDAEEEKEHDEL